MEDFKKKFVVGDETFKPKISSIFHIEQVNDGSIQFVKY